MVPLVRVARRDIDCGATAVALQAQSSWCWISLDLSFTTTGCFTKRNLSGAWPLGY
jgi:hypothetical protein